MSTSTLVSAPGKVLLAGGFLVLDPKYFGIVIATSARFYTLIRPSSSSSTTSAGDVPGQPAMSMGGVPISVRAAQFPRQDSVWTYVAQQAGVAPTSGDNKFVHVTIQAALRYAGEKLGWEKVKQGLGGEQGIEVVVLADNDFYSQSDKTNTTLAPFAPLPNAITSTNKTGLGSSASLVTSLSAALLSHLGLARIPSAAEAESLHSHSPTASGGSSSSGMPEDLGVVHSVAQYAHCLAQGKVGSGFDISSSVYGTHIYQRFSPSLLDPLLADSPSASNSTPSLTEALDPKKWDQTIKPFRLPRGLRLVLADVDAGTHTPSFIKGILKWREEKPEESLEIWTKLYKANSTLVKALDGLREMEGEEAYDEVLEAAAGLPIEQAGFSAGWSANPEKTVPIATRILEIRQALNDKRHYIRAMSTASGVPVEPKEQTNLLEESIVCPGVIGGTVPGAGGYDAIVLLIVDQQKVVDGVERVWGEWTEMKVKPLKAGNSNGGLRSETIDGVDGLQQALDRL